MSHPSLLSERAAALKPSLTLEISAKAKALKKAGQDICSLSAGEPDFSTPDFIIEAAQKALFDGVTKYGPSAGDPELREAIATKISIENHIPTTSDQILVTNGGKQAIYNLFQVLLNPGDEVLIPSPYWLSYPEIVKLADAKPITVKCRPENGFEIDINSIESAINSNTRLLILNTPSNPTGKVISLKEFEAIAELLRKYPKLLVMTDEIYEYLLDENQTHYNLGEIAPDLINRIFIVNGFAKGWAMTGWRIGYLRGDKEVIDAASALQSQSTSNVCSFAQRGALAAITGPRDCINKMVIEYNSRRNTMIDGLKNIKGINIARPKGAFYAFPQLPLKSPSSIDFCRIALDKVGLAIVPGEVFGDSSCVRLSFAVSNQTILDGLERLNRVVCMM